MNNSILIIAHAPLANALRQCALHVFPDCGDGVAALDVQPNVSPEETFQAARISLEQARSRHVLVLTDVSRLKAQQAELEALARERALMFNLMGFGALALTFSLLRLVGLPQSLDLGLELSSLCDVVGYHVLIGRALLGVLLLEFSDLFFLIEQALRCVGQPLLADRQLLGELGLLVQQLLHGLF